MTTIKSVVGRGGKIGLIYRRLQVADCGVPDLMFVSTTTRRLSPILAETPNSIFILLLVLEIGERDHGVVTLVQ
jgi:hypothetical protein